MKYYVIKKIYFLSDIKKPLVETKGVLGYWALANLVQSTFKTNEN
jgi:hypothetical protein